MIGTSIWQGGSGKNEQHTVFSPAILEWWKAWSLGIHYLDLSCVAAAVNPWAGNLASLSLLHIKWDNSSTVVSKVIVKIQGDKTFQALFMGSGSKQASNNH